MSCGQPCAGYLSSKNSKYWCHIDPSKDAEINFYDTFVKYAASATHCFALSRRVHGRQDTKLSGYLCLDGKLGRRQPSLPSGHKNLKGVWHEIFSFKFFSWISVPQSTPLDTGDKHSFENISANFLKNSKRPQGNTHVPGIHWFMKKNLKSKISCQTPFNSSSWWTYCLFDTSGANIFINPRPVCCGTEKGGKGEKDTGITTRMSVTRHVARGYLPSCSLRRWRGTCGRPPPPPPI